MEDTEIKNEIMKKYEILEGEIFKECQDFPKYYISSMGRLYSERTHKFLKPAISGVIKKGKSQRDGYYFVCLQKTGNGTKLMYIHRLVAQAYYPDENFKLWVNHKNKIHTDNNIFNLEFVKPKRNVELGVAIAINVRNIENQEEISFVSISAASRFLVLTYYSIYHALSNSQIVNNYEFKKI